MKILMVAYYYPPMGGAGVQRVLKFSKYLPEFGVQSVVLAASDPDYVTDRSLADEIPAGVEIHRVEHRPLLQRILAWRARAKRPSASAAGGPTSAASRSPLRGAMRDALLGAYEAVQFPDDKAAWARRAFSQGRRILREQPIDLIFSSAPPASAHALAARLSREASIPWVADFRDLWTDNPGYAAPNWRRALDRRTESAWLQQAAGIVTVTPSWRRMLAQRVPADHRVAFIPNGYDEADFDVPAAAHGDKGIFRLVHTGTFYGPRDPGTLLDGVSAYLANAAATARQLRVRLIGNMGARFEKRLAQFDELHPGVVERVPYLPHRQALAEMMAADALLLVVGGAQGEATSGWLPGKIFEYLRAAKPVLLLGDEEGDAAELVRRDARAWVVDPANAQRIAQALEAMLAAPSSARDGIVGDGVYRFERRELSRQLAEFLTDCADRSHGRA